MRVRLRPLPALLFVLLVLQSLLVPLTGSSAAVAAAPHRGTPGEKPATATATAITTAPVSPSATLTATATTSAATATTPATPTVTTPVSPFTTATPAASVTPAAPTIPATATVTATRPATAPVTVAAPATATPATPATPTTPAPTGTSLAPGAPPAARAHPEKGRPTPTPADGGGGVQPFSNLGICPPSWGCADIGGVAPAGSQTLSLGTWSVSGGGLDIWGTSDQFHYVWQPLPAASGASANGSISARVVTQTVPTVNAKAGVMLRASTAANAPNYMVDYDGGAYVVQYRATAGGSSAILAQLSGSLPIYLKAVRVGTTFTAYTSSDGGNWTLIPGSQVTIPALAGAALAGLAVNSYSTSATSTAQFDTVLVANPLGWAPLSPALQAPRQLAASAVGLNGDVYVFGGSDGMTTTATTYIYNPATAGWTQGATMPTPREGAQALTLPDGHIAVLGGDRGCGPTLPCASGGQVYSSVDVYDPASDTWNQTQTLPALLHARQRFAAVLTQGQIYVIGGADASSPLASVETYNLTTHPASWSSGVALPGAEMAPAAAVDGAGAIDVAGGFDGVDPPGHSFYRYSGGAWSSGPALAQYTQDAAATTGPDGQVYVVGGYNGGQYMPSVQVYNPTSNSWHGSAPLPAGMSYLDAVTLPGGQLLTVGGGSSFGGVTTALYRYGPSVSLTPDGGAPGAITTLSGSGFTPGGTVAVGWGSGTGGSGATVTGQADALGTLSVAVTAPVTTTQTDNALTARDTGAGYPVTTLYAGGGLAWDTTLTSLRQGSQRPAAALAPDGRIVVVGGSDGGPTAADTTQVYSPTTDTWSTGRTMPISRDAAQAQPLTGGPLAGDIAVFGGGQVCFFNTTCAVTATMDAYNPTTDSWTPSGTKGGLASMHTPRYRFASVALGGQIYAIGGWTGSGNTASMERYDPASNSWTTLAPFTTTAGYGLEGLAAAAGPDGRIYVAGGLTGPPDDSGGHPVNTVYIYTPSTNSWVQGPSLPVQAEGLAATQFSATLGPGGKVYVLGGFANIPGDYALQTGTLGLVAAYDARSGRWQRMTSLPYAADGTAVVSTANGQLFVIGGAAAGSLSRVQIGTVTEALGGSQGWHPHRSVPFSDGLSAAVDLADGHVDVQASGLSLPARGPDLAVGQTWDSVAAQRGDRTAAGQGWSDDLTPSMGGVLTQTVSYTDSQGTRWLFPYYGSLTATSPYTAYSAPPGRSWALTTTASLTGTTGYALADFLTGEVWQFDGLGRLTGDTDAYGNSNALAPGSNGPTSLVNSGGRKLTFTYNASGLLADAQSPLWQSGGASAAGSQHVSYGYNGSNQLTSLTRGTGTTDALTATFGYSGTQLVSVTTPFTGYQQTWTLGYDGQGRVVSVTSPISGTPGQAGYTPAYTTQVTYGMSQTVVVAGVGTTGAETTTYTLDAPGEATATQDGDGNTRTTSYDTDHDPLVATEANGNATQNYYQYVGTTGSTGLVTQTVQPEITAYTFTTPAVLDPVVTSYKYNPTTDDRIETDKPDGGIDRYAYDGGHSVITTTLLTGYSGCGGQGAQGLQPLGICQRNYLWRAMVDQYDRYGEKIASIDGRGLSVTQDATGTVSLGGVLPASAVTRHYSYDPQGDQTAAGTPPISTTLNGVTTVGPVTTTTGHDLDGNPITTTAANGNTTATSYDHLGRAVRTTLPPVAIATDPGPATLGYTTVGATEDTGDFNDLTASRVVVGGQSKHVVTLSAYVGAIDPTPANDLYQVAIYTDSGGSPGALVASSATGQLVGHAWNTLPISADLAAGTAYWLVYNTNGSDPSYNNLVYDTAGSNVGAYASQPFGAWPASFGSATLGPWQYSLYVTFGRSPVETTQYDGDGNAVRSIDANGDVTTSSYDPMQREVATTNPVSGTSSMTYSATQMVASRDPQGNLTTSVYDGAGRLLQTIDPSGGVTQYQYDPEGNTTAITSTTAGGNPSQVDVKGYNALNQVVTDTVGLPGQMLTTRTAYDYDGNVVQVGQPNGDTTFDTYRLDDLLNTEEVDTQPVMTATNPPGSVEGYSYDDAGQVTSHDDFDGRVLYDSYDGDGRAIQDVTDDPGGTPPMTTTTGYDPDGNVLAEQVVTATAGSATTNGYNAADWPITTTETSSDGAAPLTTAYGYDAAGQQRSETILDGQTPVTTTLDAEGRATSLAENAGGTGPYTGTYGYYPTNLAMTASVPGGAGVGAGITFQWRYDGSDRLTRSDLAGPTGVTQPLTSTYAYGYDPATGWMTALTGTINTLYGGQPTPQLFTHDSQGRLIRWQWPTQANLDEGWSYDGNGNVVTNTEHIDGQYRTTTYTYTASLPNELQAQHTDGLGVETYTYDHYGNTTSLSATDALTGTYGVSTTIGYDSHARPVTIRVKSQTYSTAQQVVFSTVSFGYNAQGRRSSYAVSTPGYPGYRASYRYRDGGPNVAQAVVTSGTVTGTVNYTDTYLYDQNGLPYELLRQYQGQPLQRYWYAEDGQGDVVAPTDVSGNVVDRYAYDPWGEGLAGTVSERVPQPLRYRGYWWDPELGWYWVNVRSLDPEGRWLQPDPSEQDGVRTYAYLGDDPVDGADPLGLHGGGICNIWIIGFFACNQHENHSSHGGRGAASIGALVTVGRWMARSEYDKMEAAGQVQESYSGATFVTYPPNPFSFKPQKIGDVFATFKVPLNRLVRTAGHGGGGWYRIATAKTIDGRLAARKGQPVPPEEMPEATDIKIVGENTSEGMVFTPESGFSSEGAAEGGSDEGGLEGEGGIIPGQDLPKEF